MTRSIFMDKYPVYTFEAARSDLRFDTVDAIVAYLKDQISADPVAAYIGDFDHFAHTEALGGEIHPSMKAARMVVFCFGQKLPNPNIMAVRPRSIAVADMGDSFVFTFLEAPMEAINGIMEEWIRNTLRPR